MSSIIVCINNNLKHDMRVLRQVGAFSEDFDKVIVCAKPVPDKTVYFEADNIEYHWFEGIEAPDLDRMRELAKKYGLLYEIAAFAPIILDDCHGDSAKNIEFEKEIQKLLMNRTKWDEVRKGLPAEAIDDEQISWVLCNLDKALIWADFVATLSADIIYCNDMDTMLCGVVHKKVYGSRFVYDEHDLYCDAFPYLFPMMYRYFIALYEYEFIKYADAVITVSESAVKWLKETCDLVYSPLFVPNCKDTDKDLPLRGAEIRYPVRLYFQGFADAGKGLDEVIEALRDTDEAVLHLRCLESEYVVGLKKYVSDNDLGDKVRFFDPVSPYDVISATNADGDIGLTIMGGETSIGIRNTITNKLIEYLTAGLPVIVSAGMFDQARIVKKHDAGFVIERGFKEELQGILDEIRQDPALLREKSINAKKTANEMFRWEVYKDRFLEVVTGRADKKDSNAGEEKQRLKYEDLMEERAVLRKIIAFIMESRSGIALENKLLELEIRELKESNSFKTGRLITAPARLIKRIIKK